jgi:hypothetical protein
VKKLVCVYKMQCSDQVVYSLAPGFSPVWNRRKQASRFNDFFARLVAAEAAEPPDVTKHQAEARC